MKYRVYHKNNEGEEGFGSELSRGDAVFSLEVGKMFYPELPWWLVSESEHEMKQSKKVLDKRIEEDGFITLYVTK